MTNIISKEEFTTLINHHSSNCISIYLPAHRAGVEVNEKQDAIVFKNLLQAVNNALQNKGYDSITIGNLLKPGFELYNNEVFWNNQLDGLAVFIADDFFKTVKLPFIVKEEFYVNSSFLVSPLLPAITNNEEFYLLVLSKHDAKFYQGNAFGLQYMEVEGLPNGIEDVVHFEEKEGKQLHRRGSGNASESGASLHGHESQLDDKVNLTLYFQEVDRTLFAEVLHDKHIPLLLAGVEYLIPVYKGISRYRFIVDEAILGNHEHENANTLFPKAHEIIAPYFVQRMNKALENYYNQIATPLTSSMPEKVIPASHYAQVADLFICRNEHIWGKFDEMD
ncbi:MAG: hypothetical protein JWQ06_2381, partial [Mucilaginibacter sp.]|nr:hypothetical protein [Mucilaginibacter sp.]